MYHMHFSPTNVPLYFETNNPDQSEHQLEMASFDVSALPDSLFQYELNGVLWYRYLFVQKESPIPVPVENQKSYNLPKKEQEIKILLSLSSKRLRILKQQAEAVQNYVTLINELYNIEAKMLEVSEGVLE